MTRRRKTIRICLALLFALLLTACGRAERPAIPALQQPQASPSPAAETAVTPAPTPAETPAPSASVTPAPTEAAAEPVSEKQAAALAAIRDQLENGRYYEAFEQMLAFEQAYPSPDEVQSCETLFAELDSLLREIEPASGTELARSFSVQGGGVLEVSAFSGPVLVTVIEANGPLQSDLAPAFSRFYVRQGELGSIHLPVGSYRVRYKVGYRWFGDETGFGKYCSEGELDEPLVFDYYMDSGWASNSKYTITI